MYQIIGKYQNRSEVIDEFDDLIEAQKALIEYEIAYGIGWSFRLTKARK